jgi:hypothetical protein
MHISWIRAGRSLSACPLCVQEQADAGIPTEARIVRGLPCAVHGDPRYLWPENFDAVDIWNRLTPGDFVYLDMQEGAKTVRRGYLDKRVVKDLCDAYSIDYLETLDKLSLIHKEFSA